VHLPEPPKALKLRYAFLTLYSFKHRIRIFNRLQKFIKDDIGFGRKGGRKG
jgi:hypothetical protein